MPGALPFLADAPWDKCAHGHYEFKCVGCWEALVGQAKKAEEWQAALEDGRRLLLDLRTEVATLTPTKRDERQRYLLERADELVRRLFG